MSTSATDLNIIKFSPKTNVNTNPLVPETNKLTAENINEILNFLNENLFPIGTMIFNDNPDFDPNVEYGGTWELIKGKMIIGFDDTDDDFNTLGKTGGSKTHTQTVEELAAHNHGLPAYTYRGGGNQMQSGSGTWYSSNPKDYTDNTGNSQPMDIMNPHYVANIWHRVA